MATILSTLTTGQRAWHADNGCCKHPDASVTEGACCICDAEAPCESALAEIEAWVADHDCVDFVTLQMGVLVCQVCDNAVPYLDAACSDCGGFPCHCDAAYEAHRDRELGL